MERYGCWIEIASTEVYGVRLRNLNLSPFTTDRHESLHSIGLSNGALSSTVTINKRNDLQFDALLTSDIIGTYKPGARMYETALKALNATGNPGEVAMVAAHAYDTEAAAKQ